MSRGAPASARSAPGPHASASTRSPHSSRWIVAGPSGVRVARITSVPERRISGSPGPRPWIASVRPRSSGPSRRIVRAGIRRPPGSSSARFWQVPRPRDGPAGPDRRTRLTRTRKGFRAPARSRVMPPPLRFEERATPQSRRVRGAHRRVRRGRRPRIRRFSGSEPCRTDRPHHLSPGGRVVDRRDDDGDSDTRPCVPVRRCAHGRLDPARAGSCARARPAGPMPRRSSRMPTPGSSRSRPGTGTATSRGTAPASTASARPAASR